ncbi:MAG: hypothetical protein QM761_06655 [Pseudoxanthomonas sp.]
MKLSNRKCLLVVEDDEPKMRSVVTFLQEKLPAEFEVVCATSLSSAIRLLSSRPVLLAIVDMSLPTFDFAIDRSGGQPQGFGGMDILRFIESETPSTRSVVLTQYEEFPTGQDGVRRDISRLEQELKDELGTAFLGVIHYAGQQGDWRDQLSLCIDKVVTE